MEQRLTSSQVVELYDRARAGYPQALYDDLIGIASLAAGDAVLEVGCGAGKETIEANGGGFDAPVETHLYFARRKA